MASKLRTLAALALGAVALAVASLVTTQTARAAPPLQLPWPTGEQHKISGGNTYGCDTHDDMTAPQGVPYGAGYYAIDFQFGSVDGSPLNVAAAAGGRVIVKEFASDGYGRKVVIDHDYGQPGTHYYSVYAHLASYGTGIDPNVAVAQGRLVGIAGNSGGNYDVHLHFHMQYGSSAHRAEPMSGVPAPGEHALAGTATLRSPAWGAAALAMTHPRTGNRAPPSIATSGSTPART